MSRINDFIKLTVVMLPILTIGCSKTQNNSISNKDIYEICREIKKVAIQREAEGAIQREVNQLKVYLDLKLKNDADFNLELAMENYKTHRESNPRFSYKKSDLEEYCEFIEKLRMIKEISYFGPRAGSRLIGDKWDDQLKLARETFELKEILKEKKPPTKHEIEKINSWANHHKKLNLKTGDK